MLFKGKVKYDDLEVNFKLKATAEELLVLTRNQVELNAQSLETLTNLWKAEFENAKEEGRRFKRFRA